MNIKHENLTFPPDETFIIRSSLLEINEHTGVMSHPSFEIVLTENCRGKRFVGGHAEDFHGTELMLFGRYLPHGWRYCETVDPDMPAHAIVVNFLPDFLGRDFLKTPEAQPLVELFSKAAKGLLFTADTVIKAKAILQEMLFEKGLKKIALMLLLLETLAKPGSCSILNPKGHDILAKAGIGAKMNDVLDYLGKHYLDQVSLEEVASIVPMSKSAFCRFFKAGTGKTFTGLIKEMRIRHAARLLIEGKFNISETCYESGYSSISHFNKDFKDVHGISPKEFIKRYFIAAYEPEWRA
jgi:AraC-like DNA-binding protein